MGSVPGRVTKIPCTLWYSQKKKIICRTNYTPINFLYKSRSCYSLNLRSKLSPWIKLHLVPLPSAQLLHSTLVIHLISTELRLQPMTKASTSCLGSEMRHQQRASNSAWWWQGSQHRNQHTGLTPSPGLRWSKALVLFFFFFLALVFRVAQPGAQSTNRLRARGLKNTKSQEMHGICSVPAPR